MKVALDDLPGVSVCRLRASGAVTEAMQTTTVVFGEVEFVVGLAAVRFPNGGSWSLFQCPCGRLAKIIRLYEGGLACSRCLMDRGLRSRVELIRTEKRGAYHASRLIARLTSKTSERFHPHGGMILDKRRRLEAKLRRAEIVARQFAIDEHDEMLR